MFINKLIFTCCVVLSSFLIPIINCPRLWSIWRYPV